jgi:hypothetical protein
MAHLTLPLPLLSVAQSYLNPSDPAPSPPLSFVVEFIVAVIHHSSFPRISGVICPVIMSVKMRFLMIRAVGLLS